MNSGAGMGPEIGMTVDTPRHVAPAHFMVQDLAAVGGDDKVNVHWLIHEPPQKGNPVDHSARAGDSDDVSLLHRLFHPTLPIHRSLLAAEPSPLSRLEEEPSQRQLPVWCDANPLPTSGLRPIGRHSAPAGKFAQKNS